MLNPCWLNTKRFLSVLVVFGKSFVFTKMSKISKIVLSCFCDSVTGWSSRMSQSRAHTEIFRCSIAGQCPSHEKYLEYFSKFGFLMFLATHSSDLFAGGRSSREGTQKFSRLTSRLPREKHLDKFFKFFFLSVLATGLGNLLATWLNCENRVFWANRSVFKLFQFFPRNFVTIHCLPHFIPLPNTPCTQPKPPLLIISPRKRYGFLFSHSILHVYECISSFCEILLSLCVLLWFEHGFAQNVGFSCLRLVVFVARLLNMFAIMI